MTVKEILPKGPDGRHRMRVECDCGATAVVRVGQYTNAPPAYCKKCAKTKRYTGFMPRGRVGT